MGNNKKFRQIGLTLSVTNDGFVGTVFYVNPSMSNKDKAAWSRPAPMR